MKLHLGAGTIYLKDYVNVDVNPHYLANNAPEEILEKNTTVFESYYKHEFGKSSDISVVDIASPIDDLPFENNIADEVVLIQVLEHIPQYNVDKVLKEISRVLKIGGFLIVGVPDVKGLAEMLVNSTDPSDEDWCIRLIHGTQKNQWSHHYCGYTERTLKHILSTWFQRFEKLTNISFYPSIYLKAFKDE